MTTLPHSEHAIRRKAFAPHYTLSNLELFQPEVHHFTLRLTDVSRQYRLHYSPQSDLAHLKTLDRLSGKTSVECLDLFRHFFVDIMSSTLFGSRSGSLDAWSMNVQDPLTNAIHDFPIRGILVGLHTFFLSTLTLRSSSSEALYPLPSGNCSVISQIFAYARSVIRTRLWPRFVSTLSRL